MLENTENINENQTLQPLFFTYKITNNINGKIYIGQTGRPNERWSEHKYDAKKRPKYPIHFAIKKYGEENFTFIILEHYYSIKEANEGEIKLIAEFNATNKKIGYNIHLGGRSKEWTQEEKNKLSENRMGDKNPFFGKTHTLETKKSFSKRLIGNTYRVGQIVSDETKEKLSKVFSGEGNLNSKLTKIQVDEIRRLYSSIHITQKQLAIQFNVAIITISRILTNKSWTK